MGKRTRKSLLSWDVRMLPSVEAVLYFTFKNEGTGYEVWPYDKRFHILLNLAIGGNWGGQKGIDDSLFPHVFEIDYVRVYKK